MKVIKHRALFSPLFAQVQIHSLMISIKITHASIKERKENKSKHPSWAGNIFSVLFMNRCLNAKRVFLILESCLIIIFNEVLQDCYYFIMAPDACPEQCSLTDQILGSTSGTIIFWAMGTISVSDNFSAISRLE